MKYVYYQMNAEKRPGVLLASGSILPLEKVCRKEISGDLLSFIRNRTEEEEKRLREFSQTPEDELCIPSEGVRFLAPIERPLHDILCVGVNYGAHLRETEEKFGSCFRRPKKSVYFSKRTVRILGDGDVVEGPLEQDTCLDYEVELAVVIGKTGKDIPKELAEEYIFGYSVFNDLSCRTLQEEHNQWFRGKSLDGLSVMGPCILSKDALPWPVDAEVISRVNGEERQHSSTRYFLADISEIISEISSGMTLEAGDIIATGTPSGVGMGMNPPGYLRRGDSVICEIPGIGKIENRIR